MTRTLENSRNSTAWRAAPAETVREVIARTALNERSGAQPKLGSITLHAHQSDAELRLRHAIERFGGALLADEVGLGKTFVALAVARSYAHTHLLAPAALLPMWREAIRTAGATEITLRSLHAMSGKSWTAPAPSPNALVIIDEAHHLRTRTTRRYRHASQLCATRNVLLVSATPLHNSPAELRALLALFLGNRADALDDHTLAALVVRRTHQEVQSAQLPVVKEHQPFIVSENTPVLDAILTLPPPLPARLGTAAGALVRLGLLRAWCSSDAALADALRKRRLRGEALLHALSHGRHPTQSELRSWTTGTDAVQLGFPELLVRSTVDETSGATQQMLLRVTAHLTAIEQLERLHTRTSMADPERCAVLRLLLREEPRTPVLAFSQFASTVKALFRALADVAGVASLTSHGGRVAGGPLPRHEIIARFAPRAHERPPPPEHEAIKLLLTTDVLSEGINLQDAGRLVHLDLPWTAAARAQRVGRLVRIGSPHSVVHVHSINPPPGIDRTLRIVATLARKAGITEQLVGRNSVTERARSRDDDASAQRPASIPIDGACAVNAAEGSSAERATRLREVFLSWLPSFNCADSSRPGTSVSAMPEPTLVATVAAGATGWIAAVHAHGEGGGQGRLIAHRGRSAVNERSKLKLDEDDERGDSDVASLLRVITCIHAAQPPTFPTERDAKLRARIERVLCAVQRNITEHTAVELAGARPVALAGVRRQLLELIAQTMASIPAVRRPSFTPVADAAQCVVLAARGVGGESALQEWRALARTDHTAAWMHEWKRFPVLSSALADRAVQFTMEGQEPLREPRIAALLLLMPAGFP